MLSPQEYQEQQIQQQQEEALENLSVLMALDHQVLRNGNVRDEHAEGLLDMVRVWQESNRVQLDIHGLSWV